MPALGGPLGISLAPQVRRSKTLYKILKPIAEKYAAISGYRQIGLRYEDLLEEENEHMQKALRRLPEKEQYDRIFRMRRAFQCSVLHRDLPVAEQTKPEEDTRYLSPLVAETYKEFLERKHYDNASSK